MCRIFLVLAVCCLALSASTVHAAQRDRGVSKYFLDQIAKQQKVADELAVKIGEQNGEAPLVQQEAYLRAAGWMIYYAFNGYSGEHSVLPGTLTDLVEDGWLTAVPLNVVSGEPMQLLTPTDGISPGDAVLEVAPPEFYSLVGTLENHRLVPLSFQLGVYAPLGSEETNRAALPENIWADKPAGLAAYYGTFSETAESTLKNLQERASAATIDGGKVHE